MAAFTGKRSLATFSLVSVLSWALAGCAARPHNSAILARGYEPVIQLPHAQPEAGASGERDQEVPKDQPGEAMELYLSKRAVDGRAQVPFDRYLGAQDQIARMRHIDIAQGRLSAAKKSPLERQLSLGQWREVGPTNIGGRARALVFDPRDPNVMYLGAASGGVFKSTDSAQSWTPIGDMLPNMAVNALAIDPKNPDTLYAGTGEGYNNVDAVRGNGIFRSTDAGKTWTALPATRDNSGFFFVNKLIVSHLDSNRLYAATGQGVFRSLNAGETWERVLNRTGAFDGCSDLVLRTDGQQDFLFASCGRFLSPATIFRNTAAESDALWEPVLTDPGMARSVIAIAPSQPSTVYVLSASFETGPFQYGLFAVYRSTNNGEKESFEKRVTNQDPVRMNTLLLSNQQGFFSDICGSGRQQISSQGWYNNSLAVDPVNPDRIWAGGVDVMRSDDGGANWGLASDWNVAPTFRTYVHADQHLIVFHPKYDGESNRTVYFLNDGGLNATDNALAGTLSNDDYCDFYSDFTHKTLVNGMATTQFYHGQPYPGGAAWIGGKQDNGTSRGTLAAGPGQWEEILGGDGGYVAIAPDNPNRIYAEVTRLSLRRATDGFSFATAIRGITEASTNFLFITPFRMDPNDSQRLYIGGRTLWRTTDGGDNWTAFSPAIGTTGNISAIAAAPGNPERVAFATTTGRVFVTNSASTATPEEGWANTLVRLNGFLSWLEFDPTNSDILYATVSTFNNAAGEGHVFRSTDGGATWERRDAGLPDIPAHSVAIDPANPSNVYLGTDLGLFASTDSGASWAKEDSGFVNTVVESMSIARENGASTLTAFTHGRGVWQVHLNGETPNCTFSLEELPRVSAVGNLINSRLDTGGDCVWSAVPASPWARAVPAVGKGPGSLPVQVSVNPSVNARETKIYLADKTLSVKQDGATPVLDNSSPTAAFVIATQPFAGSTDTRTVPGPAPEDSPLHTCTESRDSRHTWFKFTPDFSGSLLLSAFTLSPAGTAFRGSVITLYEGDPVAANERACARSTTQVITRVEVEAGKTYFIQASGTGANNLGGLQTFLLARVN